VEQAFGRGLQIVPGKIEFVFSWLTILFIAIGILTMIVSFTRGKKLDFLLRKFDAEYFTLVIVCFAILVFSVVTPHVSTGYGMERTYFQLIVPLSIFFVIGGIMVSKHLKLQPYLLLLIVLIPYFMCTTGTMYQIFDVPREITLNSEGAQYNAWYIFEQESYGAKWLMLNNEKTFRICPTGGHGVHILRSHGMISHGQIDRHTFSMHKKINGYLYLSYNNVVKNTFLVEGMTCNMSECSDMFVGKSKIYNNGGSGVWK
jgi:uncharacterized membrane protein